MSVLHRTRNVQELANPIHHARRHSALKEFQEMHAWFRPMMDTVGKRLLSKSKFGANFRL